MNERSPFSRWRLPALVLVLGIVALAAASALLTGSRRLQPPAAVRETRDLPVPYGAPSAARRYHNAKRLPLDRQVDTRAAYATAERQAARMPRYSAALGRFVDEAISGAAGKSVLRGKWDSLGPGNVGGRTRRIAIDPEQPSTIYLGGVSGGVWKSTNGGSRWNLVGEGLQNIAINSMAMHPSNSRTLVVGTGEGYFREDVRGTGLPLRGGGVFRTVNGGRDWDFLPATAGEDFWFVNDLVYSADGERIYAATRTGVHRSGDGGDTWERILRSKEHGGCLDLAIRSDTADDVVFASCGTFDQASIYRSLDAAERESRAVKFQRVLRDPGMGRTSIALAPSDQNVIYALAASNQRGRYEQALHAVFRSDSGGDSGTWVATVRNNDPAEHNTWLLHNAILLSLAPCGFSGNETVLPMGWYVNALAVDPVNPNRVWAGGVDWFRSSDGGTNWAPASYYWAGGANPAPSFVHADQHTLVFHPDYDGVGNQTIYIGNDGGIWRSTNAGAAVGSGPMALCAPTNSAVQFNPLNFDLGITQFYHGLPFPDGNQYLGGTQDNGTRLRSADRGANGWRSVFGGDGGYVAIDPRNDDVFYVEAQNGNLVKTTDGGATVSAAANGLPPLTSDFLDPSGNFVFVTPFVMDPSDPDRLWIGGGQMFRTDDGAANWQAASKRLKGRVTATNVAADDSDRVAAGTERGFIYVTDRGRSSSGSTKWLGKRPRKAWVTWVAFDPDNPDTMYATYGGFGGKHVYRSTNGGRRWQALDGDGAGALPDIPVHVVLVDPGNTERLFIGTDLGVFVSPDGGTTWAQENAGFGNIVTESLHLQREDGRLMLYAFTHGRGAWRVQLRE